MNRAFTPKVVARIEESVRDRARRLVGDMVTGNPDGRADLVSEVAAPLPLQIICDMMGIPEEDEDKVFHWTTVIMGAGDEEASGSFDEIVTVIKELALIRFPEERHKWWTDFDGVASTAVEEIARRRHRSSSCAATSRRTSNSTACR